MSTEVKNHSSTDSAEHGGGGAMASNVIGLVTVVGGAICFGLLIFFGLGH